MSLFIYNDGVNSIATQLLAICEDSPINITATGHVSESVVSFPTNYERGDSETNWSISKQMVLALVKSISRIEIWPIELDTGLPTSESGTRLTEEKEAALVLFDQYPNPLFISIYYYATPDFDAPIFLVNVSSSGSLAITKEYEAPRLMLVHLLAHAYSLIDGTYDPSNPEYRPLELENYYRAAHSLKRRVDSHIERGAAGPAVYNLGGCGC